MIGCIFRWMKICITKELQKRVATSEAKEGSGQVMDVQGTF